MAPPTGASSPRVFVHLSDLHFRTSPAGLVEREAQLRDLLLEDIPKVVACTTGKVEGVLLTGDIARSGQATEYAEARGWLNRLCDALDVPRTMTFTVPGNHDIDWSALTPWHRVMNEHLRQHPPHLMDEEIDGLLGNPDILLSPIENYQEFAAAYACDLDRCLAWEAPPIPLGEGYALSIRGANSVINSDGGDGEGTMAVQLNQLLTNNVPGIVRMLLMHHGPSFWRSPSPSPADCGHHIVLYGHTHEADHHLDGNRCVEITAGAIHPEEKEEFAVPGYNVVEISIEAPPDKIQAFAHVRIFHRDFSKEHREFVEMGCKPSIDERLAIPRLDVSSDRPAAAGSGNLDEGDGPGSDPGLAAVEAQPPFEVAPGIPDPTRLVRLEFESLGAGDRMRLLDRVGIDREEIAGLPPHRQIRRIAEVVVERALIDSFEQAVAELTLGSAPKTEE